MKHLLHRIPYYFPLISIFLVAIVGFIAFQFDRTFQMYIVVSVAVSYCLWGIVYHILHKNLTIEIVFEYIIVSVLGLAGVLTVLL